MEKTERDRFESPEITTYDREELELPRLALTVSSSGPVASEPGAP